MNPSIKPSTTLRQTGVDTPFLKSFSGRLIKQICRFLQIDDQANNTCFVDAKIPVTDGMKTDPASLSTRTLLSRKRF